MIGAAVGMNCISGAHEMFIQFAVRVGFHALSSFFHDHIAFRVKFTKDRIEADGPIQSSPRVQFYWRED